MTTYREHVKQKEREIEERLREVLHEAGHDLLRSDSSEKPLFKGLTPSTTGFIVYCKDGIGYRVRFTLDHEPDLSNGDAELLELSDAE